MRFNLKLLTKLLFQTELRSMSQTELGSIQLYPLFLTGWTNTDIAILELPPIEIRPEV